MIKCETFPLHHQSVEGQNFWKSIFILVSNTGGRGRDITKEILKFRTEGKKSEYITYRDSLSYWPQETQRYRNTGCKRVANKMNLLMKSVHSAPVTPHAAPSPHSNPRVKPSMLTYVSPS